MKPLDVAIVGAGPYGLSLAAHFSSLGLAFRIFGKPMTTWQNQMPESMLLKSDGFASSLSAPQEKHRLKDYCAAKSIAYHDTEVPVELPVFNDYAMDFQRRFVPDIDQRSVTAITPTDKGFRLTLENGEEIDARRVVMAVGITHFDYMPEPLSKVGGPVSHSSAHREFERFRNSEVTVVGAGASAIDVAAHLIDSGANVNLVMRAAAIRFSSEPHGNGGRSAWYRLRHPSSGLGPGLRSRLYSDWPHLFRLLPAPLRLKIVRQHLGPFSIWYMRSKIMGKANVIPSAEIEKASLKGSRVQLSLNGDGRQVELDHVIAATGYRVDLSRLAFLDPAIRQQIRTALTMPILSPSFESSYKGLYFVGLAAAGSFGPLMRFMYGAEFAARRISQHLAANR